MTKYKIIAFMLSSFFSGIAGGLWGLNHSAVNPSLFMLIYSFYPIIMTSIGGLSSISGAVFGAFFFRIVSKIIEDIPSFISDLNVDIPAVVIEFLESPALPLLIFSIILILVVRFAKEGVMKPLIKRLREFFEVVAGK